MGSFGDVLENALLNHVFQCGGANYTPPAGNIHVALSTADPGEAGAGIAEPSGGSYARVAVPAANWATAANGVVTNANDVAFTACTVAWGTIAHFALFDANVAGNMLAYGALSVAKAVAAGDVPKFITGDIVISLT